MNRAKPAIFAALVLGALSIIGWGIERWARVKYGKKTQKGDPADALLDDHKHVSAEAAVRASLPDMCEYCKRVYLYNLNETKGTA